MGSQDHKYTSERERHELTDFAQLHKPHRCPQPTDLASDVLDALTRKLRDYDRLSAALTSAQAEATKNLERARKAEARIDDADPSLPPLVLIETVTNALGSACTAHYEGDIALTWRRYPDGLVDWWTLAMGETATFGSDGACLTEDALGDVNAILARYGYVLEAWP